MREDKELIKELVKKALNDDSITNIERLGGLTNRTYHVSLKGKELVVRLPGIGTEEMINRKDEETSTRLANKLGIDATLYYFDSNSGEKVSEYITDAKTLHPEDLRIEKNILKVADTFSKLHSCQVDTKVPFNVLEIAKTYEKVIIKGKGFFYDDYDEVKQYIDFLEKTYLLKEDKVPCHNDALCENWILKESGQIFLVDWEYAGMNYAMWDLAEVSIEADMDRKMDDLLLRSYLKRDVNKLDMTLFMINKVLVDYLWSLWGKTRAVYDGQELEDYAYNRWLRLRKNMNELKGVLEND